MLTKPARIVMLLVAPIALAWAGRAPRALAAEPVQLEIAKIFFEYNSSAKDLGVQVSLDGEDWKRLKITNPKGKEIFSVQGSGPYKQFGLTELFFEGAEPSLADVPLEDLLAKFPAGSYEFRGKTVDGGPITGTGALSHAIPDGPVVSSVLGPGNSLVISWTKVTAPPAGFPAEPITIVGYQVIVDEVFQVTVPGTTTMVTVSPEFVAAMAPGPHAFEVLAIEASGNQTITEGSFTKP